jgi:FkbM family methyltransferase
MPLAVSFIVALPRMWAGIRTLRGIAFSAVGRDPLGAASGYRSELAAVRVLREAHLSLPTVVGESQGRKLWRTSIGEFWAPAKGTQRYALQLEIELRLDVYRFNGADTVIDCGANIGTFSRHAIRAGARRVIAFEPDRDNIACFRENLADEIASGRVTLIEKGAWSKPDELWLSSNPTANPGSSSVGGGPDGMGHSVEMTTIDSAVELLGLERVDFLKMDIEGAEVEALKGARRTIMRCRPTIALGTEHTADILEDNLCALEVVSQIGPDYRHEVTEAHACRSPKHGWTLAPHSMVLSVPRL